MKIVLEIHQDEAFNFFAEYDKLSALQKEIWKYISWFAKSRPVAFPSQTKMAAKFKCSRKHVNRTLALFRKWGWLWLQSRGRKKSKILNIPSHLLQLDIGKREYFKRVEVTSKVTHSLSRRHGNTSGKTGGFHLDLQIPEYLQKTRLSQEHKLKLALVSQRSYQEALEIAKFMYSKGKVQADKVESYVVGTAIRLSEKYGEKLEWKRYYETIKTKVA